MSRAARAPRAERGCFFWAAEAAFAPTLEYPRTAHSPPPAFRYGSGPLSFRRCVGRSQSSRLHRPTTAYGEKVCRELLSATVLHRRHRQIGFYVTKCGSAQIKAHAVSELDGVAITTKNGCHRKVTLPVLIPACRGCLQLLQSCCSEQNERRA